MPASRLRTLSVEFALKEANETGYLLELLLKTSYIDGNQIPGTGQCLFANPGYAHQIHQYGKGRCDMKIFTLPFLYLCLLFMTGCSGYSRLPKIDFIGKSRDEVIRIFAQNPEKAWGTHINICIPLNEKQPYICTNNLYFKTLEEALANEQLKKAPSLSGYRTLRRCAVPAGWDYYQVTFDENNIVVSQETNSLFDGP